MPRYVQERTALAPAEPGQRPRVRATERREGDLTFPCVVLENEYLCVRVIPSLAGQVHDVVFKPTGDDLFYREDRAKPYFAFIQSGVRGSFPKSEHGMFFFGQPASWRVLGRGDGSVTLAMWMDFSRHQKGSPQGAEKAFTPVMLTQLVTLRPREGLFSVTYRLVNPCPYRVGRQFWNDAFFPRNHGRSGVVHGTAAPPARTATEWVYPAAYVSTHSGADLRLYAAEEMRLGESLRGDNSVFAWDMPYGFAGLWYPEVGVSRLRIWDPVAAPGAKQYFRGEGASRDSAWLAVLWNLVELWGGTDCLFEGVENWLEAGEAWEFTHRFALVRGIGKVQYADERLAVNVDLGGAEPRAEVVTFRPTERLEAFLDGAPAGRPWPCAPDRPAAFRLPRGRASARLRLVADGAVILDQLFPLRVPVGAPRHALIRESLDWSRPGVQEMATGSTHQRTSYRQALKGYGEGTVDRGRVLYRDGQLDLALESLQCAALADAECGEGWHLLGAALLEKGRSQEAAAAFGRALTAARHHPPARYFLALDALARGSADEAAAHLARLTRERPAHWEGRLLAAYLEASGRVPSGDSLAAARLLESEDPADPRVLLVLWKGAEKAGDPRTAAAVQADLGRCLAAEPGARRRLAEFEAAARGQYLPPLRAEEAPPPR